jgi:predicted nucleotidyltransferase
MSFKADELKVKIRSIVEKYLGLKLVVLFGSHVDGTESTLSDVDLLVEGEFSEAKLLMDLAEALNMPVERIDLLRVEHTPIKVLARALSHGVIILCREPKLLEKIVGEVALEYSEVIYSYRLNIEHSLDPGG